MSNRDEENEHPTTGSEHVKINVPRPLSLLPFLTVALLIGVVIAWLVR